MTKSNLSSQALALHQAGNFREAETLYRTILASNPHDINALNLLGTVLSQQDRHQEGLQWVEAAIALKPDFSDAYNNHGIMLEKLGRYEEALASCDKAIALDPNFVEAYSNRANALQGLKRYDDALASCNQAIAINPCSPEAHNNRAHALQKLERYTEALASCEQAIALAPRFAQAHSNRSHALEKLEGFEEALASSNQAVALAPTNHEFQNNRAIVLEQLLQYDEALKAYDAAIALYPDYASAHWNKGLVQLRLGKYKEGWELYEWRWKRPEHEGDLHIYPQAPWLGKEPVSDQTILLHSEQGLGDSIQFCRYVPLLAARGAKVILEVPDSLIALMSTLEGNPQVISRGSTPPPFNLHCPLMSLPLAFETICDTIPAHVPYLHANPEKHAKWKEHLGIKTKPRIGLAWSGIPLHKNDHNRSMSLETLAPLWALDMEFHCLQKEIRAEDMRVLSECPMTSHTQHLQDFSDTAALAAEMDLIISVDTSVAHLAGALGKPVWIMLPFIPDWRWMMHRKDSLWYPTARLFREPKAHDWASVVADVVKELGRVVHER